MKVLRLFVMNIYSKKVINDYRFEKLNINKSILIDSEDGIKELIKRYIGIHSARVGYPYLSFYNKGTNIGLLKLFNYLNNSEEFLTVRCMRKTLHLCCVDDLPMVHFSTLSLRLSIIKHIEQKYINKCADYLLNILPEKGECYETLINNIIKYCNIDVKTARMLFKYFWETGKLKQKTLDPFYAKRQYTISKYLNEYDGYDGSDVQQYVNELVRRYIVTFGPVTLGDICWWTGLSLKRINIAINNLLDDIEIISINNFPNAFYVMKTEIYKIDRYKRDNQWCKFLTYEDSALKAYKDSRFLFCENEDIYYNAIGEVRPSILIDGVQMGLWYFDKNKYKIIINGDIPKKYQEIIYYEKIEWKNHFVPKNIKQYLIKNKRNIILIIILLYIQLYINKVYLNVHI